MGANQNSYTIVSNERLTPRFWHLCVDAESIADSVQPGQFIHIKVREGMEPFFRRPFSVYRALNHIEVLYEVVGKGTEILSQKKKGDALDVLGPLGTPFTIPDENIENVVMVGGGIGVAPFMMLSDLLKAKEYKMLLLYGGRSKDHVYDMKELAKNGCDIHIATNDGSHGVKGFVSELFSEIPPDSNKTRIYTCGPKPMMAAVQDFARTHNLKGEASCEEVLACGLGACLGCVTKTEQGYKTVCYDGPVFDLKDIVF
ncbi:MAG: dihydroorotate dehydrogenase electron transfer subunit [Candidatus Omnitrophica bacterium]|nr:dihydroorotate dehydrogenase electron transfer subunit [Candidatus Omnitrophota bacterium]